MLAYLRLERTRDADRGRDVAGEGNLQLVGFGRERVEDVARHARMDLEQVVAGLLLGNDRLDGDLDRRRGLGIERRP